MLTDPLGRKRSRKLQAAQTHKSYVVMILAVNAAEMIRLQHFAEN